MDLSIVYFKTMKSIALFCSQIKYVFPRVNFAPVDRYVFIDRAIYVMSIIGFIMTVPQITKIWLSQSAAGISLATWTTYLVTAFVWLSYGIIYKNNTIVTLYSIWIFLETILVFSIIKFS